MTGGDRGQAFSLEGLVSAVLVISALLFALQAVVVTPTTRGTVDEDVRTDMRQQAADVLAAAEAGGSVDLSYLVRYWRPSDQTFYGANNPEIGYGLDGPPGELGTLLNRTFTQEGDLYNVVVVYNTGAPGETRELTMVRQGTPDENAVVASRVVTLYDNATLTAPGSGRAELWQYDTDPEDGDDGYYPIPDAVDGPVYNVVEIRVIVW